MVIPHSESSLGSRGVSCGAHGLERDFDRRATRLFGFALRLCRNADDAEDLVQQTILTALEKSESFDRARELDPWLLGIMVNHHRGACRRYTRRIDLSSSPGGATASAAEVASDLERDGMLAREVAALPDPYRSVVERCYFDGLSHAQLAARFRRPASTISTQLRRGLALLRLRVSDLGLVA